MLSLLGKAKMFELIGMNNSLGYNCHTKCQRIQPSPWLRCCECCSSLLSFPLLTSLTVLHYHDSNFLKYSANQELMGMCGSCLRLMLDAESDVKIHVIEPTSVGVEHSVVLPPPQRVENERSPPTLQVPEIHKGHREGTNNISYGRS
ncbi:unnamed protein product [Cylicocyclus nassatus]|uniref:Uncharacterized protein n=1 Tax=Cylicocyclus nassatus TaxID=53992 RepID=A0AA36HFH6_CYLNA|nr:unnamed protein product [Cylicocyclus nassatus]